MTVIGGAELTVSANVESAIASVVRLRQAAGRAFGEIEEALRAADRELKQAFNISPALKDFKVLASSLSALDSQISSLASSAKGLELKDPFREALNGLRDLRAELAKGLGDPTGTLKEQRALQSSLFRLQTEEAHQAAVAKEQAYLHSVAVAEKAIGEERRLQEGLFLLQTQEAHQIAVEKEQAYLASVKAAELAAKEERRLQEQLGAQLSASINRQHPELFARRQREFDQLVAQASGLGVAFDKSTGFINRHNVAINQLAFGVARAGGGFANFAPLVARVTTLLAKHEFGGEGGFRGALDKLKERFDSAGAAGARFGGLISKLGPQGALVAAGLVAAAAAVTALAVGIGFLAVKLGPLGGAVQTFRERLQLAFGEGADVIRRFADTSAEQFGLTEVAALKLTGTIGNVFKSFGVAQEDAAGFALALADAALIIQRTSFTTDTLEQVTTKLKGALTGNVEALREYGIAVNEATIRDVAAAYGINLMAGELDAASKALLAEIFILDQAKERQDEFGKSTESVLTEQEKLAAAVEEFKTTVGEDLVPVLRGLVDIGQYVIDFFGNLYDRVTAALGPLHDLFVATADFLNLPEIAEIIFGPKSEEAFENFARGLGAVEDEITAFGQNPFGLFGPSEQDQIDAFREKTNELFEDFTKGKIDADEFFTILAAGLDISPEEAQRQYRAFFNVIAKENPELEKYRDTLFDTSFAQERLAEELRKHQEELRKTPEFMRKLIDAYEDLNKVVKENAERLKDAQEAVVEAREEGAKAIAEAEETLADSRKDGAKKIRDAEKDLADAREDRLDALKDAQEAVDDAEEAGRESIAKAEEKLRDTRIDAAKRIDDAERALAQAREQRADSILDAQLSLEEALLAGDAAAERRARLDLSRAKETDSIKDAQRKLQEARIKGAEDVADAEKDLAKAVEDAEERISKAKKKQADVIEEQNERVIDAEERLAEAREDVAERIIEAQERVDEAEEKAIERLQEAKEKLHEVAQENRERLEDARKKVLELEGQWEETNEELQTHLDLLRDINAQYLRLPDGVTPNAVTGGIVNNQFGGPLRRGDISWVGEAGPELFIPDRNGQIISNDVIRKLITLLNQGYATRGQGSTSLIINEAVDAHATADAVMLKLGQALNN